MPAWSYSYLTAFEQCPRRFKLTRVDKTVRESETDALRHGNEVHKALELAVGKGTPLPAKYAGYSALVNAVIKAPGTKHVEIGFGLTSDLKPTGFFAKDVWVRGKLDVAVVNGDKATILDWKTGKPKPDADQLQLFAAAGFAIFPNVETIKTGYAWLAHNKLDSETYLQDQAPRIWGEFKNRVRRIEIAAATNDYPPRPSGLCQKWCPVPRGQCEFSGR